MSQSLLTTQRAALHLYANLVIKNHEAKKEGSSHYTSSLREVEEDLAEKLSLSYRFKGIENVIIKNEYSYAGNIPLAFMRHNGSMRYEHANELIEHSKEGEVVTYYPYIVLSANYGMKLAYTPQHRHANNTEPHYYLCDEKTRESLHETVMKLVEEGIVNLPDQYKN
ncbi:hypothetical protein [Entomobacter blattae]|uniref:Uncharacterized protein n=1 Tax=Entomobacter blattae TaxID=2762277 RepID=A0A7H1NUD7_9PROT|nr:hypothetical protein [Entomobacter blattae]QNT79397.1 hypothetical protein JGUZn3_21960 [Entomobacter blattae]